MVRQFDSARVHMRKLPKIKFMRKNDPSPTGAVGLYHSHNKQIEVAKGMPWNREMEVLIHETIHFLQDRYHPYLKAMNDEEFVRYNETNNAALKICKQLVQDRYRPLFKKHGRYKKKGNRYNDG
jgi:hypothetical protein